MPDASTYPLPPRHSSASAAWPGTRLQTWYFATAVARRLNTSAVRGRPPRLVVRAREAHRGEGRGLGLDREVGEDVRHRGLVGEARAERAAVGGVPRRLGDGRAHPARGPDHAVQAGVVDHLDDRRHPAARLADHARVRAAQLDLARRVRAVAELVLEPLDLEPGVARAVGQDARQGEARQALGGLGQDEEQVAHRGAAEPLVAGELVLGSAPARPAAGQRGRARRVRADVGAALLLGHRHAAERARLLARGPSAPGRRPACVRRGTHSSAISGCASSAGTAANVIVSGQPKPASAWTAHW